jgi:hypothetical protein
LGRFEYDAATGDVLVAAAVGTAIVLGFLAFNYQGSPRMDDKVTVMANGRFSSFGVLQLPINRGTRPCP